MAKFPASEPEIRALAAKHGLALDGPLEINDMGLDFRVVIAKSERGAAWVLRIPRRADVLPRAEYEAKVLAFLEGKLPAAVPEWRVFTPELIAYPHLSDPTALSFDPATYAVTWHMDQNSPAYVTSLARVLVALHALAPPAVRTAGLTGLEPDEFRGAFEKDFYRVRETIGVGPELAKRLQAWIDDESSWPGFATLVHGDLYAGHLLVDKQGGVTGIIDWTEAKLGDPAVDFASHLQIFGRESLERLLREYERAGGRGWPRMPDQIEARLAAAPIRYGVFAIESGHAEHLAAAKTQLGVA